MSQLNASQYKIQDKGRGCHKRSRYPFLTFFGDMGSFATTCHDITMGSNLKKMELYDCTTPLIYMPLVLIYQARGHRTRWWSPSSISLDAAFAPDVPLGCQSGPLPYCKDFSTANLGADQWRKCLIGPWRSTCMEVFLRLGDSC